MISKSVLNFNGSTFSLIVPLNKVESYIIIVIDSLTYYKESVEISIPSIQIVPDAASNILSKVKVIVDLPAPVLPTTPIFSFYYILTETFYNAKGSPSLYRTE